MKDCIFCQIVEGSIPSTKVYEDDDVLAIMNIQQINYGHTLVIPKEHAEEYHQLDEEKYSSLMRVVKDISSSQKKTYNPTRVGLMVQGFEVAHAHVHVVPLYEPTDITSKKILDKTDIKLSAEEMNTEANKIKKNL